MVAASRVALVALAITAALARGEDPSKQLQKASDEYMREELGVNEFTTPTVQSVLNDLEKFKPIPLDVIAENKRDATFSNRFQTALHFGSLVADGFMLTLAERSQDVHEVGKALIRQALALGVGERLTRRSKSILEFSDKGDWLGMRQELIRTQEDVEKSMMELRDEEMAHLISLGGWMRGFQLAAHSVSKNYSKDRARSLARVDIMDYFLDRLETLNPRLKKTELVTAITAKLKAIRALAAEIGDRAPKEDEIARFRQLADEAEALAMSSVDDEGRIRN